MENRISNIEKELTLIKERNVRVEAEKAWETSIFRKATIAVITYVLATFILYFIGVQNFFLSALIPTIGYILSTLSLPFIKRWWIENRSTKKIGFKTRFTGMGYVKK
jgi:membrane protease YdiL (CAAX protease family)